MTLVRPARIAILLCSAAILWGTLTPLPELPNEIGSDKLHHFIAFFILAGLTRLALTGVTPLKALAISLAYAAALGGGIELIQPFVNRHGDWADFHADLFGALIGALCGQLLAARPSWITIDQQRP